MAKTFSKKSSMITKPYSITASDIATQGRILAYGCGYDWCRGCEEDGCMPNELFVHPFLEDEVKGKRPYKN